MSISRVDHSDMYYKDGSLVGYSTSPLIGAAAQEWPERDLSMHGIECNIGNRPRWTPEIKFFNSVGLLNVHREDYFADRMSGRVGAYIHATGTFSEALELQNFPFDRQLFHIVVSSEHRAKKLVFIPHFKPSKMMGDPRTSEWKFDGQLLSSYTYQPADATNTDPDAPPLRPLPATRFGDEPDRCTEQKILKLINLLGAKSDRMYNTASFQIIAQRRFSWFLINTLPFTFLIGATLVAVPFIGWSVPNAWGVAERIQIILLLILTLSVYKTWLAEELPKIPYITKVDKYLTGATVTVGVLWTIETMLLQGLCEEDSMATFVWTPDEFLTCYHLDRYFGLAYVSVWTIAHVAIWCCTTLKYPPEGSPDRPYPASTTFRSCPLHISWEIVMKRGYGRNDDDLHA